MAEEFKSIDHHPDTRRPEKRGRPFFSIRRRVNPDTPRKLKEEQAERFWYVHRFKMKVFLVTVALAPIVYWILIVISEWHSHSIIR